MFKIKVADGTNNLCGRRIAVGGWRGAVTQLETKRKRRYAQRPGIAVAKIIKRQSLLSNKPPEGRYAIVIKWF